MTKRITQLAGVAALTLATAAAAFADVKLNDNISLAGYVVGLADSKTVKDSENASSLDLQATKLVTKVNFAPVSGTVSLYAGANNNPVILDAYFTYDLGKGNSITGGKFLSWLGYEAFDPINMINITYAWTSDALGAFPGIPGYHTGVKFETSSDSYAAGFAVLDSDDSNYFTDVAKGDGDIDSGGGLEAYYTYKGKALTVFGGLAYNSHETEPGMTYYVAPADGGFKSYSADLWAQYVTGALTFAGEVSIYKASFETTGVKDFDSYFYGIWAKYAASEKVSYVGRLAGGEKDTGATLKPAYTKFTFSPILTLTANLEIAGEASYTTYSDALQDPTLPKSKANPEIDSSTYFGVQARFKF
jgi:hypothetical protein